MIPAWILRLIERWINNKKTGSLKLNFFKGGVSNVEKNESMKE